MGPHVFLVFLLALALIYIWFQHHRAKLQDERLIFTDERRRVASEEVVRQVAALNANIPHPETNDSPRDAPTILVVDDEEFVRRIITLLVKEQMDGVSVNTANDGDNAINKVRSHAPALMILDIAMPRKSGFDVLAELSRMNVSFPIIVSSGWVVPDDVASSPQPVNSRITFVPKPYTAENMISAIEEALKTPRKP